MQISPTVPGLHGHPFNVDESKLDFVARLADRSHAHVAGPVPGRGSHFR